VLEPDPLDALLGDGRLDAAAELAGLLAIALGHEGLALGLGWLDAPELLRLARALADAELVAVRPHPRGTSTTFFAMPLPRLSPPDAAPVHHFTPDVMNAKRPS
jgi:hypothetical protein